MRKLSKLSLWATQILLSVTIFTICALSSWAAQSTQSIYIGKHELDPVELSRVIRTFGDNAYNVGDYEMAHKLYRRANEYNSHAVSPYKLLDVLRKIGDNAYRAGYYEKAWELYAQWIKFANSVHSQSYDEQLYNNILFVSQRAALSVSGYALSDNLFMFGRSATQAGYDNIAHELYVLALKYNPKDMRSFEALRQSTVDSYKLANTIRMLGDNAYEAGDHENADTLYKQAIKLDYRIELDPIKLSHIALTLGDSAYEAGDYKQAIGSYKKVLDYNINIVADPIKRSDIVRMLGDEAYSGKRYERALKLYQQAIEYNPKNEQAYEKVIQLVSQHQQYQIDPLLLKIDNPILLANDLRILGDSAYSIGNNEKAFKLYQLVLKYNPKDEQAYEAIRLYNDPIILSDATDVLGDSAIDYDNYEEAIGLYKQALLYNPNNQQAYNSFVSASQKAIGQAYQFNRLDLDELANYLRILGDSAYSAGDARAPELYKLSMDYVALSQAIKLAKPIRIQGNSAYRAGNYEKAIMLYQQALKYYPNDAETYSSLGLAYWRAGKLHEAIDASYEAMSYRGNDRVEAMSAYNLAHIYETIYTNYERYASDEHLREYYGDQDYFRRSAYDYYRYAKSTYPHSEYETAMRRMERLQIGVACDIRDEISNAGDSIFEKVFYNGKLANGIFCTVDGLGDIVAHSFVNGVEKWYYKSGELIDRL